MAVNKRFIIGVVLVALLSGPPVLADRFESTNYTIDAGVVGNSLNGPQGSTNYHMVSSGGESVVGNAASGSYKMTQGYVAQLEQSIELSVGPSPIYFGTITPGVSNTEILVAYVKTDAPGYNLGVSQDHDLQNGANTIAAVSGSINSPITWSEGTTKGLGFSLVNSNATPVPAKWSAGNAFAAFPASNTTVYSRTGFTGGTTDVIGINLRIDVPSTQLASTYTNTVTWTGTITP